MKRICKQCGKEFNLTQEEIAFYQSKNLHIPKRCEKCRLENKMKSRTGAGMPPKSVVPEKGQLDDDYEKAALGQEVRAYKGTENRGPKAWIAVAAVLILLAVGIVGWNLLSGTGNDAVEQATVNASVEKNPTDDVSAENGETQTTRKTEFESDIDISRDKTAVVQTVSETEAEEIPASETEAEEMPVNEVVTEEISAGGDAAEEITAGETAGASVSGIVEEEPSAYVYTFRSAEALQEHFEKHGAEFGYASAEEYLAGANRVIASPEALHKLEAEDNDDVYYLESTNEFVIVSTKGYLRTYFKPSDGKAYYDRQ